MVGYAKVSLGCSQCQGLRTRRRELNSTMSCTPKSGINLNRHNTQRGLRFSHSLFAAVCGVSTRRSNFAKKQKDFEHTADRTNASLRLLFTKYGLKTGDELFMSEDVSVLSISMLTTFTARGAISVWLRPRDTSVLRTHSLFSISKI